MIYFPRIDHARGTALRVELFPGAKVCARISVKPLRTRIPRGILGALARSAAGAWYGPRPKR